MLAPSGEQYEINGGGYRAFVTECGAGLRVLEHAGRGLLHGYAEDEQATAGRGQLLMPWPNRLADGRYSHDGRDLQLPITEVARGHAIHGLVRWVAWTVREHTSDAVSLGYRLMSQPGYPWTLDLTASYAVSAAGLEVEVTATNRGESPAPFAAGAHPYLTVGESPVDAWTLTLPGRTALEVDDRMIPTGTVEVEGTGLDFRAGRVLGTRDLDTAYTDLERDQDGWAEVRLTGPAGAVALRLDRHHRWVQAFVGPPGRRDAVAIEPMTAPPNALATGDDVITVGPDERVSLRWGIHV